MTAIWKYLAPILKEKIVHLTVNVRETLFAKKSRWNLTLIKVGFLSVRFWARVKLPHVENSLELWCQIEIWYESTNTYVVSENIYFSTKTP